MCLAIPAQVKELGVQGALVDVGGVRRKVNVDLLEGEGLQVGDWVLLHVGFAMSRISEEEAQEQLNILAELGSMDEALEEVHGLQH